MQWKNYKDDHPQIEQVVDVRFNDGAVLVAVVKSHPVIGQMFVFGNSKEVVELTQSQMNDMVEENFQWKNKTN